MYKPSNIFLGLNITQEVSKCDSQLLSSIFFWLSKLPNYRVTHLSGHPQRSTQLDRWKAGRWCHGVTLWQCQLQFQRHVSCFIMTYLDISCRGTRPGKHTKSDWKWSSIVDLPIEKKWISVAMFVYQRVSCLGTSSNYSWHFMGHASSEVLSPGRPGLERSPAEHAGNVIPTADHMDWCSKNV